MRKFREVQRSKVRTVQSIAHSGITEDSQEIIDQRDIREISTRLRRFLNHELATCPRRHTRES
jgi:hypothetical protein